MKETIFLKRHSFMPSTDKTTQESMKNVLKNKVAELCFNKFINVAFHDLSINKEANSVCDLTSLLGLGPKFSPKRTKLLLSLQKI